MSNNDNAFDFKNFKPGMSLYQYAMHHLSEVSELAPYDATSLAEMEKKSKGYDCSIQIYFPWGLLGAKAEANQAEEAIDNVTSLIKQKIAKWNGTRFE